MIKGFGSCFKRVDSQLIAAVAPHVPVSQFLLLQLLLPQLFVVILDLLLVLLVFCYC